MAKKKPTNYPVGYSKPPTATQFKKGASGNPKGRPKGSKNLGTVLQDALESKITVREGDSVKTMTGLQALVHSQVVKAIQGDPRAVQAVLKLIREAEITADRYQAAALAPTPTPRTGVLVVPPFLSPEDWDAVYGSGPVDREELKNAFNRMHAKGQVIMGIEPPNTEDSGE